MMSVILVVAHDADRGADAVIRSLLARGRSVRRVKPEWLALARWSMRVGADGRAATRILLPDGEVLDGAAVAAVWSRIRWLPQPAFRAAPAAESAYAASELRALVAGWLASFGARAVPDLLACPWASQELGPAPWRYAAAAGGLRLADDDDDAERLAITSAAEALAARVGETAQGASAADAPEACVTVVGDAAYGDEAGHWGAACCGVAARLGFALAEFRFQGRGAAARLTAVDTWPALADPVLADAAARWLIRLAASPAAGDGAADRFDAGDRPGSLERVESADPLVHAEMP